MREYPRTKYQRDLSSILVNSSEEEAALVGEWGDGPLDFGIITAPGEDGVRYDAALDKFKAQEPVPEPVEPPSE